MGFIRMMLTPPNGAGTTLKNGLGVTICRGVNPRLTIYSSPNKLWKHLDSLPILHNPLDEVYDLPGLLP